MCIRSYPLIGDTSRLQSVQDGCSSNIRRDARRSGSRASLNARIPALFSFIYDSLLLSLCHLRRGRMLLASAVVVWEWLNEHGRWRPYSPAVCHHIEAVIRSDPRCGSVVLGQVDLRLSPYIIDLHSMHQFRQDTGEQESGGEVEQCGWPFLFVSAPTVHAFMLLRGMFDVSCSRRVKKLYVLKNLVIFCRRKAKVVCVCVCQSLHLIRPNV